MDHGHFREDMLVPLLQQFVRFPSQQTDLQETDPQVKSFIQECAGPMLRSMGAQFRCDPMGNLIVEVGRKDNDRSLLFVAYAMTHPAAAMQDPFSATVIDTPAGRAVRGRGVAEQKTALAALFGAFGEALRCGPLNGRLILALTTAGETGRHDAVESVMSHIEGAPDFAVICIGTGKRVAVGNKGRVDFDVVVRGKASHSSAPWNGVNAITGASRVLAQLEHFDLRVADHPSFGAATLTATAIDSSPKATHTVPDMVRMTFDRRVLPGEDPQAAFEAISGAIALEKPWSVECRRGPVMHPNEIALDGPLFSKLRAAFARAGQGAPEPFYCNFALDAGYFARKGVEAVMLGPGDVDQFHSNEERVLVSDLVDMAKVYYGIIQECLSPAVGLAA
jgi:acetylornithine deacetylase